LFAPVDVPYTAANHAILNTYFRFSLSLFGFQWHIDQLVQGEESGPDGLAASEHISLC